MSLAKYVSAHCIRGACQCGKCIDAPENPEGHQPKGHTADLVFFRVVATNEPDRGEFLDLVRAKHPNWLDGKEHSYIEMGADMGNQSIALMTMGLGELLIAWKLLTPNSIMPLMALDEELRMQMAGMGMVTIRTLKG